MSANRTDDSQRRTIIFGVLVLAAVIGIVGLVGMDDQRVAHYWNAGFGNSSAERTLERANIETDCGIELLAWRKSSYRAHLFAFRGSSEAVDECLSLSGLRRGNPGISRELESITGYEQEKLRNPQNGGDDSKGWERLFVRGENSAGSHDLYFELIPN